MPPIDLPPYIPPLPTKCSLDYAPLAVIDLSTFDHSSEDRARLAEKLRDAAHNTGFWVVTGHGITDEEVNRHLSICQAFYKIPMEEKRQYPSNFVEGKSVHPAA
jgi:isopenicillin N synthase-like dioxygenase